MISAKLRLYVVDGSSTGGDWTSTANTTWSENTVTWSTAPDADGIFLDSLGTVSPGTCSRDRRHCAHHRRRCCEHPRQLTEHKRCRLRLERWHSRFRAGARDRARLTMVRWVRRVTRVAADPPQGTKYRLDDQPACSYLKETFSFARWARMSPSSSRWMSSASTSAIRRSRNVRLAI